MFKVAEIFEKQMRNHHERPDGNEHVTFGKTYDTRECLINARYVVCVRPHEFTSDSDLRKLEGVFPEKTQFSVLVLDGNSFRSSEMIVVGSFVKMCRLLQDKKT